jgi:hypothetical protein
MAPSRSVANDPAETGAFGNAHGGIETGGDGLGAPLRYGRAEYGERNRGDAAVLCH